VPIVPIAPTATPTGTVGTAGTPPETDAIGGVGASERHPRDPPSNSRAIGWWCAARMEPTGFLLWAGGSHLGGALSIAVGRNIRVRPEMAGYDSRPNSAPHRPETSERLTALFLCRPVSMMQKRSSTAGTGTALHCREVPEGDGQPPRRPACTRISRIWVGRDRLLPVSFDTDRDVASRSFSSNAYRLGIRTWYRHHSCQC
jgi:hypothetical protein